MMAVAMTAVMVAVTMGGMTGADMAARATAITEAEVVMAMAA